jgi:hypothetical protein
MQIKSTIYVRFWALYKTEKNLHINFLCAEELDEDRRYPFSLGSSSRSTAVHHESNLGPTDLKQPAQHSTFVLSNVYSKIFVGEKIIWP